MGKRKRIHTQHLLYVHINILKKHNTEETNQSHCGRGGCLGGWRKGQESDFTGYSSAGFEICG